MFNSDRCTYWLLITLTLFCSSVSVWGDSYALPSASRVELNSQLYYLEDVAGKVSLAQLLKQDIHGLNQDMDWQRNDETAFSKGFSSSVWWFRLSLSNTTPGSQHRMLELLYPNLDFVDIYVVHNGNIVSRYETGDRRDFNTRAVHHRNFVTPLTWAADETLDIYYRVASTSAMQVPVRLWLPEPFYQHTADDNLLHGFYYGAMLIIAAYNLLIFLMLRDWSYLYYVCFILASPLYFLSLTGMGYQYIWPNQVEWNSLSLPVSLSLLILLGASFTRRFIQLKRVSIILDRIILSIAVFGAMTLILSFFLPYPVIISILIPITLLASLVELIAGSVAWYRGVASARFYVIAWSCLLVATIVLSLQKIDLIPNYLFVGYTVQLGSMLEALLLSFALADRINEERRLRFEAQAETINTTRSLNAELENRVEERTIELEHLNQQLETLSNTDQLTQLYNRRYLEQAGSEELKRSARYHHYLSILLLDIDHFKKINDVYGHPAGDACLQVFAQKLNYLVRIPTDIIARYGGEEFCILLPETNAEDAAHVAERIRSQIESMQIEVEDITLNITVSIGIHCLIPDPTYSLESAFKNADTALYQAKHAGRNCVRLYHPEINVSPTLDHS